MKEPYRQRISYMLGKDHGLRDKTFSESMGAAKKVHKQLLNDLKGQVAPDISTERILLACSGGIDSIVLFHYLLLEGYQFGVCTINHSMRAEAIEEIALVEWYCEQWQIPCYIYTIDVPKEAKLAKESLETTGRRMRYHILRRLLKEQGYTKLATAHHGDDQVETILMHLLRGSHIQGLQGMQVLEDDLWRPFLGTSKGRIRHYGEVLALWHGEDRTNEDLFSTRNRVRHEVIPTLEGVQPNLKERLHRLVEALHDDDDALQVWAESVWEQLPIIHERSEGVLVIKRSLLRELPVAVLRRVWAKLGDHFWGPRLLQRTHIESLVQITMEGVGKEFSLGQMKVLSTYDTIKIGLLSLFQKESYTAQALKMTELRESPFVDISQLGPREFLIPRGLVEGELSLRHRREGDRVVLLDGMGRVRGHRPVKDWCREKRIPAECRDALWFLGDDGHQLFGLVNIGQPIVIYTKDAVYYRGSFEEDKNA